MSLVEYHDPDGLFELIEGDLRARLPLQNLHWKSAARPLRSITKLQVNFVKDDQSTLNDGGANESGARPSPNEVVGSEYSRRHQIPGLRHTPYLKLYLLRCDDNETYKSTCRSRLREWIKSNGSSTQSAGGQAKLDRHDAFEWLIIHVVPLTGKQQTQSTTTNSKSTSALLDKIKSDFNTSSKNAPDRVAQILVNKQSDANTAGNSQPPFPGVNDAIPDQGWNDVVEKLKSLILTSFSLRVGQYEDDIQEKESQRALPGWNFSTFFILKEGLAIAFQSVGLNEDALSIYDELSLGLETAVHDTLSNMEHTQSTSFAPFTSEMRELATLYSEQSSSTSPDLVSLLKNPLDLNKKDYRGLIVSSRISVFDFANYIFARQCLILFHLANIKPSVRYSSDVKGNIAIPDDKGSGKFNPEVTLRVAEICERATKFVTFASRVLRADVWSGIYDLEATRLAKSEIVDRTASSWSFSIIQQILGDTDIGALPAAPDMLQIRGNKMTEITPLGNANSVLLATERADLIMMQRKCLSQEGEKHQYTISPRAVLDSVHRTDENHNSVEMLGDAEVDGNGDGFEGRKDELSDNSQSLGTFAEYLQNKESFQRAFERLTVAALWFNLLSNRKQTSYKLFADLAILKLGNQDFASSAAYFAQISRNASEQKNTTMEPTLGFLHSTCLKKLHRRDEYIRVVIGLLQKFAETAKGRRRAMTDVNNFIKGASISAGSQLATLPTPQKLLSDLVEYSRDLTYNFPVDGAKFIDIHRVDHFITLQDSQDGFLLQFEAEQFLGVGICFDSVELQLVSKTGDQERFINLETEGSVTLGRGSQKLEVHTTSSTYGTFLVGSVSFRAGRIIFNCNFQPQKSSKLPLDLSTTPLTTESKPKFSPIICYPHPDALDAKLTNPRKVYAGKRRAMEVTISTGANKIVSGDISIKPASAGLRLHTSEFSTEAALQLGSSDKNRFGTLSFGDTLPQTNIVVDIPFDVEQNVHSVSARLEVNYVTEKGTFTFTTLGTLNMDHPLDINVQDIFREDSLISKVLLQPNDNVPVRLLDVELKGDSCYEVQPVIEKFRPLFTFRNQPVCASYKIKNATTSLSESHTSGTLLLSIDFSAITDEITNCIEDRLLQELISSPFKPYCRLVLPAMRVIVQRQLSPLQMEHFSVADHVSVPDFDESEWAKILWSLPQNESIQLRQWLQLWHAENPELPLAAISGEQNRRAQSRRTLLIDFTVPDLQYAHTTRLVVADLERPSSTALCTASVGRPLSAVIDVKYTKRWGRDLSAKQNTTDSLESFYLDIQGDTNTWLVGGQRRTNFDASEGQNLRFHTTLIPLRPGNALLPHVEIKKTQPELTNAINSKSPPVQRVTCETNCLSKSEVILIVEDMENTTLALSLDVQESRGATLLESGMRNFG